MKTLNEITKEDIENAVTLNEAEGNSEYVTIEGLTFKKLNITGDEYAKIIGAIPYEESKISKL